jgi:arylsulfatase A-like enzyme
MRPFGWVICWGALAWAAQPALPLRAEAPRPNIVHIFADDFGWGSVGFNGQVDIETPNLDALALGGMKLTNAYSAPVCAPSRAMLYTGFHQGHAVIDGNDALSGGDSFRSEDVMTGQVLKSAGYSTGVFGKWGFGSTQGSFSTPPTINSPSSLPNNHGFDEFYGYLNHGAAHDYFFRWMWQTNAGAPNGMSVTTNNGGPGGSAQYTHDLIAARSEQYLAAHAGDAQPFYMQVNYTIPHTDIEDIASAPGGYGIYAGKPGWSNDQKAYAAMITRMDASIGSLISRLDDPNGDGLSTDSVLSNTLVLFTSDNGGDRGTVAQPTPELVDFFDANGPFRGGKFTTYEGGIHMPAVAYWPGTIAPASTSDYRTDLADFMATAADLAGAETPVGVDGTSIAPSLTGAGRQRQREYLVFEHQGSRGAGDALPTRFAVVRQDGMKLIFYGDESRELYDLNADPTEQAPLNLSNPANAAIAADLYAGAVAEGALRGVVQFRSYSGPSGGHVQDDSSWIGAGRPNGYWSATIANSGATPRIAYATADVTTLGVDVRGQTALQVVDVHAGSTLLGRNEVRISANGRVDLSGGTLASSRWVNIRAGGELRGQGTVVGDVYNEGLASPGRHSDALAWPIAPPPPLPPMSLDTGVTTAVNFNFAGVQDDVPLLATSTLHQYVEVSQGLDFGPGIQPKLGNGGTDAGNEFNIMGQTGASLAAAIANGDFVSFEVDAIAGAGVIPASVSFRVWRNGGSAAKNFAILSSVDGFTAEAALTQAMYTDTGSGAQHTLTASLPAIEAVTEPIEYRLYLWGASDGGGNTHVNLASLGARFVAVPTLEFDFSGVQDVAPLTALKRQDANLHLAAGLHFGPGVSASGANNAGNEFHVAGFSTGGDLQSALDGGDYLSFAVQPVQGIAMYPDSVSFKLWRQGSDSATDYAVFSSVGGFAAGQQLAQGQYTSVSAGNQVTITGSFAAAQPTTDAVEFRLYGWNAATSLDSTHVVAASMRARFASVVGSPIDPTGNLAVQGDLFHLAGGVISIDLGGDSPGVDYDSISVLGHVELEGGLTVSLANIGGSPFTPALGDSFDVITATQGVAGEFANATLPALGVDYQWNLSYLPNAVRLSVLSSADFNRDGVVDGGDLSKWQTGVGLASGAKNADGDANGDGAVDGADFLAWQRQQGLTSGLSEPAASVPEPPASVTVTALAMAAAWLARKPPRSQSRSVPNGS